MAVEPAAVSEPVEDPSGSPDPAADSGSGDGVVICGLLGFEPLLVLGVLLRRRRAGRVARSQQ